MKQGDTITTKDGTELIAVPFSDTDAPCNGCFFYKNGECHGYSVPCWSEIDGELIFITKNNETNSIFGDIRE